MDEWRKKMRYTYIQIYNLYIIHLYVLFYTYYMYIFYIYNIKKESYIMGYSVCIYIIYNINISIFMFLYIYIYISIFKIYIHTYTIEHLLFSQIWSIMPFATMWMNMEESRLSGKSKEDKYS